MSYNPFKNISYYQEAGQNKLKHGKKNEDAYCSSSDEDKFDPQTFTEIFLNFIQQGHAKKMTHLDLSGIRAISADDLQLILRDLSNDLLAGNILSIHLNDFGINDDAILKQDIMDHFSIQPEFVNKEHKQGFYEALMGALQKSRGPKYVQQKADHFDYVNVIRGAINTNAEAASNHRLL